MVTMEYKVLEFIQQHQLIEPHKTVLVGLSGGPDSLALTHFLHKWREKWQLRVTAVIVNHQLRGKDAEADVQFVQEVCRKWNIPLLVQTVDVKSYAKKQRESIQVAARKLRYQAFQTAMDEFAADYLALGHHGDDQIETFTMQLARSAHLAGMKGIPYQRPFHTGTIIRPFLAVTKDEIMAYCQKHALTPREDTSNESLDYTRNYVRQMIVPHLKKLNENVHQTLQHLAETLREDEAYLHHEANKLLQKLVSFDRTHQAATLTIQELKSQPVSLQRRVFRLTLDYLYENKVPPLNYHHEAILLSLLADEAKNKQLHFPENLLVEKVYDKLIFYFNKQQVQTFHYDVHTLPATLALPNRAKLTITLQDEWVNVDDKYTYICARNQIDFPLAVRTRRPGDRIRYRGLNGSKKLKDLLIDEKIPRQKREEMIVISDFNGEILWVIGLRKGLLKRPADGGPYVIFRYENKHEEDIDA